MEKATCYLCGKPWPKDFRWSETEFNLAWDRKALSPGGGAQEVAIKMKVIFYQENTEVRLCMGCVAAALKFARDGILGGKGLAVSDN